MNEKIFSITRACAFTDQIFLKFLEEAKKNSFKTELDIAKFINSQIEFLGLKKSFPTIVATGKNAVDWHHKPTKTIIKKGFCVIDFGIKVNGYCSDMTRTIYFGKANNKEKKIYAKVLKANLETIKMVKEATDGNLIYKHAKKVLGKLSKYFGHGLGHGLSKKIHDKPRLSKKPGEIHISVPDIIKSASTSDSVTKNIFPPFISTFFLRRCRAKPGAIMVAFFILYKHKENMYRLLNKEEYRFR
ncbi:MAG: M24 family metallopeptidase [Candidatus Diapherotrites archaeon]